jgi:flagellar hook-associated protein 2
MATINTATLTGSSLDVKNIVDQLMLVERKPIEALQTRIESTNVRVTALGSIQSRLSALQDAVELLQTPSAFTSFSASSSNTGVLTVAASSTAVPGDYEIEVTRLASASRFALYQSPNGGSGGAPTPTDYKISLSIDGQARSFEFLGVNSLSELQTRINQEDALDNLVTVSLLDTQRGFLQGLKTGAANAIELRINGQVESTTLIHPQTNQSVLKPGYAEAADARLTVGGMDVQNAENRFVVLGLDLNLTQTGSSRVTVRRDRVDPTAAIDNLMASYNLMLAEFKAQTLSSTNTAERGVLNSDSTLAGILQQVNQYLRGSFSSAHGSSRGLSDLGLEFARDGQLVRISGSTVSANDIADRLAAGLTLGSSSTQNVASFIDQALSYSGLLTERVQAEKSLQRDLLEKQAALEEKMVEIERRYTNQYAALDALLFRLNSTSTALKSALDALTASMKDD